MEAPDPRTCPRWRAYSLLQRLAALGCRLTPCPPDKLRAEGNLAALTAACRADLAALKPHLLAILALPSAPPPGDAADYRQWVAGLTAADWQGLVGVSPPWVPATPKRWGLTA